MIAEREREKYEGMWAVPAYADNSPGERWASAFADITKDTMRGSVVDVGCGSGKGGLALQALGFPVTLADLTNEGLIEEAKPLPFIGVCIWGNLKQAIGFKDWVYCTDVLEHLPQEWTMLAVSRMLEVARRGAFFSISFIHDNFGTFVGTPLHLTVQPFTWWRDNLSELGTVVEARDLLESGIFLVEPRR